MWRAWDCNWQQTMEAARHWSMMFHRRYRVVGVRDDQGWRYQVVTTDSAPRQGRRRG